MLRLFCAIPIPPDIAATLAKYRQPLPGARWLEATDYHLTLRFVGDIDNNAAREFADSLGRIEMNAFELKIRGFGVFGGNDPRTLWAGIEENLNLDALQHATDIAARTAGIQHERQPFRPHITVARLRRSSPEPISRFLERNAAVASPAFIVDHFALFSSKPRTGGGPYVIEEHFPLSGNDWFSDDRDEYGD